MPSSTQKRKRIVFAINRKAIRTYIFKLNVLFGVIPLDCRLLFVFVFENQWKN